MFYELWFAPTGATASRPASEVGVVSGIYVPAIIYEWALLALVWFGLRRTRGLLGLIGGRWVNARQAVTDFLLGFAFWGIWYVIERFVQYLLGPAHNVGVDYFSPKGGVEIAVWVLMAATSVPVAYRGQRRRPLLLLSFQQCTALGA